MKNNTSLVYALFLVVGDFLALVAAFSVAYILRVKYDPRPLLQQIPALTYLKAFLFVLPFWILVHAFIGLYSHEVREKRFTELGRLVVGSFLGILVVIGYDFITNGSIFPARLVPVYGLGLGFGFLVLFRTLARGFQRTLFRFNIGTSNLLIIGNTNASEEIAHQLGDTRTSGFSILGVVGRETTSFKHFASLEEALEKIKEPLHSIIHTELYKDQDKNNALLEYAQQNHISYRFMPGNSDMFVGNIEVELLAGSPVIAVHQTALVGWGKVVKRLFDTLTASVLLVIVSPIFLIVAVLNYVSSGGVFFRQTRLTRFNREFRVFKFRSQYKKYDGTTPEEAFALMGKPELAKQYRENGDYLAEDPRVTPFGKFLRATSLDELPQLINVLKGDLSLVGPRALIPKELSAYEKRHTILSVKSGITGLAQVSGRRNISFEDRRKLDMYYVQNWSFWLDLVILLRTVRVVLTGEGAK